VNLSEQSKVNSEKASEVNLSEQSKVNSEKASEVNLSEQSKVNSEKASEVNKKTSICHERTQQLLKDSQRLSESEKKSTCKMQDDKCELRGGECVPAEVGRKVDLVVALVIGGVFASAHGYKIWMAVHEPDVERVEAIVTVCKTEDNDDGSTGDGKRSCHMKWDEDDIKDKIFCPNGDSDCPSGKTCSDGTCVVSEV